MSILSNIIRKLWETEEPLPAGTEPVPANAPEITPEMIHKFEKAGLGKAPFRFVGVWSMPSKSLQDANPNAYNAALADHPDVPMIGTCNFCGMAITDHFLVKSSDGKLFAVGCECINKSGDTGLMRNVSAEKRKLDADKRHAREKSKLDTLQGLLQDEKVIAKLSSLPHPKGWAGRSALDYVDWMTDHSGTSGRLRVLSYILKIMKGEPAAPPAEGEQ
jgi:hypothetical protein